MTSTDRVLDVVRGVHPPRGRARAKDQQFEDPGFVHFIFGSANVAWVFLIIRVYLGYQWLTAGREPNLPSPWGFRSSCQ